MKTGRAHGEAQCEGGEVASRDRKQQPEADAAKEKNNPEASHQSAHVADPGSASAGEALITMSSCLMTTDNLAASLLTP